MNGPYALGPAVPRVEAKGLTPGAWVYEVTINGRPAFDLKISRVNGVVTVTNREEQEASLTVRMRLPPLSDEVAKLVADWWPVLLVIAYLN